MEIFKRAVFVYLICFAIMLLVTASEANWVLDGVKVITCAFIALGPPIGLSIAWSVKARSGKKQLKNKKRK